jgi:tRNA-specific 2-thiouridylase
MARRVCRTLGIEHYTLDYTSEFGTHVIEPFCDAYLAGETPNPCIACNRYLKFEALQRLRRELGAAYVATGHYVRRVPAACSAAKKDAGGQPGGEPGTFALLRGKDPSKDQSYVLYHLDQATLAHMLFPLGDLTKAQVRAIAEEAGLASAHKAESQDICFVPTGDYVGFIKEHRAFTPQPGAIVNAAGERVGTHAGQLAYTVGQRKGLGVAAPRPLYVLAKDAAANTLVVGAREELLTRHVAAHDVNLMNGLAGWTAVPAGAALAETCHECAAVAGGAPEGGATYERAVTAKISYRAQPAPAMALVQVDAAGAPVRLDVTFEEPVAGVSPGQALVIYAGEEVLGGGTLLAKPQNCC